MYAKLFADDPDVSDDDLRRMAGPLSDAHLRAVARKALALRQARKAAA